MRDLRPPADPGRRGDEDQPRDPGAAARQPAALIGRGGPGFANGGFGSWLRVIRNHWAGSLVAALLAVPAQAADKLPNVVVLATGGTIAGAGGSDVQAAYTSGQVGVEQLLAAVPQATKLAVLRGEQIANIGSQDMSDEVWLKLARRVNELLAMPNVDGIVITHGTDTIEETAYFLNLVVKSKKPVVLTAAMRPSTALSADGPLNFFNAVAVAANKDAAGRGVLVVVNDWIHGASSLTKASTTAVQTFLSPLRGLIGTVAYGDCEFYRGPVGRNTVESEFSLDGVTALPRVDILMAHENMDGSLIDAAVAAGAKGLVIAGVGNGNMTKAALDALAAQAKKGIVCVRSTRVATGRVGRNVEVDDDKLALVASDDLNPQKARVLLRLALLKPRGLGDVQRLFQEY
jgi:L-asparaginase